MSALPRGSFVTVNLGSPREQVFGILCHLDAAGLLVRSLSIEGLEDWFRSAARRVEGTPDGQGEEVTLTLTFFPMHRVERIVSDEADGGLPSVHERFEDRVGMQLGDWVNERYPDASAEQ